MGISNPTGATMAVVAHPDDDLLFQNPDILSSVRAGGGHTTIHITAGDAGRGISRMLDREAGTKAAYSSMSGAGDWVDHQIILRDGAATFTVQGSYLKVRPDIRLYFLRLPDGGPHGDGYRVTDLQNLERLFAGEIETIHSLDGNAYTADQLAAVLLTLMRLHQPDALLLQDPNSKYTAADHPDHIHAAQFAAAAARQLETGPEIHTYIGYATQDMRANLDPTEMAPMRDAFLAYAEASGTVRVRTDEDKNQILPAHFGAWLQRQYTAEDLGQLGGGAFWSTGFGNGTGGWGGPDHLRMLADINGDGRADIVGFGAQGVFSALSTGRSFSDGAFVFGNFGSSANGWTVASHVRRTADVNCDGQADLVGFGNREVLVALADGTGNFRFDKVWSDRFALDDGWRVAVHERALGDVDGDCRDDIVAFGDGAVLVARSDGTKFLEPETWIEDFTVSQGWNKADHERVLGDVDGDGRDDIIGFGESHVIVARSNGQGFLPIELWSPDFTAHAGWNSVADERIGADVNGDGKADLVGFGQDGVHVALSNGRGFEPPRLWTGSFTNKDGWRKADHLRTAADVNGDGRADIVAFGNDGVYVMLSDGRSFTALGFLDVELRTMQIVDDLAWSAALGIGGGEMPVSGDF